MKHGNSKANPKDELLKVRVTKLYKAMVQAKANEEGVDLSTYIRNTLDKNLGINKP